MSLTDCILDIAVSDDERILVAGHVGKCHSDGLAGTEEAHLDVRPVVIEIPGAHRGPTRTFPWKMGRVDQVLSVGDRYYAVGRTVVGKRGSRNLGGRVIATKSGDDAWQQIAAVNTLPDDSRRPLAAGPGMPRPFYVANSPKTTSVHVVDPETGIGSAVATTQARTIVTTADSKTVWLCGRAPGPSRLGIVPFVAHVQGSTVLRQKKLPGDGLLECHHAAAAGDDVYFGIVQNVKCDTQFSIQMLIAKPTKNGHWAWTRKAFDLQHIFPAGLLATPEAVFMSRWAAGVPPPPPRIAALGTGGEWARVTAMPPALMSGPMAWKAYGAHTAVLLSRRSNDGFKSSTSFVAFMPLAGFYDACQPGKCRGVGVTDCDDGDPKTADLCDPAQGCIYEAQPLNLPCPGTPGDSP